MLLIFNVLETLIPKPLLEDARCANETHLGCSDNTCVPAEYFCDGSSDCEDSSDEVIIQNCIIIIKNSCSVCHTSRIFRLQGRYKHTYRIYT